jgi:hypothetical protein
VSVFIICSSSSSNSEENSMTGDMKSFHLNSFPKEEWVYFTTTHSLSHALLVQEEEGKRGEHKIVH